MSRPQAWLPQTACHPAPTRPHHLRDQGTQLFRKLLFPFQGVWSECFPIPQDAKGCSQRTSRTRRAMVGGTLGTSPRTRGATDIPGARPHCYGGSLQSGRQACSPVHPRTPETPCRRTRYPRCSRPTSSRLPVSSGGGCCSRRWWQSPQRRSASPRRPRQQQRWRAQRQIRGWLWREAPGGQSPLGRRGGAARLEGEGCMSPEDLRRRESFPKEGAQEARLDFTCRWEAQGPL